MFCHILWRHACIIQNPIIISNNIVIVYLQAAQWMWCQMMQWWMKMTILTYYDQNLSINPSPPWYNDKTESTPASLSSSLYCYAIIFQSWSWKIIMFSLDIKTHSHKLEKKKSNKQTKLMYIIWEEIIIVINY